MSLKNDYRIEEIKNSLAIEYVIKYHYLHRKPNSQKSFGLINNSTNKIVGVIIYGHVASLQLKKKMFGEEESNNIYELTRLWIEDSTPKNAESYFIGNTIRLLDKEIIVSFADPTANHVGTIYQACNFYYTGLSKKNKNLYIRGKEDFSKSNFNVPGTIKELKELHGEENVYYEDRIRKHRYIYLNCDNKRKQELLQKLTYPILSYPQKEPMNIIYGLMEPVELGGKLRYIGQSSIGVERAWQHKKPSLLKTKNHKTNWISFLIEQEKMYQVSILLDLGSFKTSLERDIKLNEAEIQLIKEYREKGFNLTNSTDGGEGTRGNVLSIESRQKIGQKKTEWLKNNPLPEHLWETCYKRKEYKLIDNIQHKHCSDCDSFKPILDYGIDKKQWDGYRTICKICANLRNKNLRKNQPGLNEEEWKKSYKDRKDAMSQGLKEKYANDPEYRIKASKVKKKPIIGIDIKDPKNILEFASALDAHKNAKYSNTYISISIKTGKPYKGYYWHFKK